LKDTQGDQVTTGFFCHFTTALPAVYDKRAKFPGHNSRGLGLENLYLNAEDHAFDFIYPQVGNKGVCRYLFFKCRW